MSKIAIPLPVSVEQIAVAVQQMSPAELERLLELVPEINNWFNQQTVIHARFYAMHNNLAAPYTVAKLPQVVHPAQVEL